MKYTYTLWRSLYDIDAHAVVSETWPELVQRMSCFLPIPRKSDAPGFSPYALTPPPFSCQRHSDMLARITPHRCDLCVGPISFLVFDVDQAPHSAVMNSDAKLAAAGIARHFYSTYSFPQKPAFRLLLPLAAPISGAYLNHVRVWAIERFGIPAAVAQCSGRSHLYFLPATRPTRDTWVHTGEGIPLDAQAHFPHLTLSANAPPPSPEEAFVWAPPEDKSTPPNHARLSELRRVVQERADRQRPAIRYKAKSELLDRCLAGAPLADHGARNQTTLVVAALLAHTLPGATLSELRALLTPSLDAMVAAGSSVTYEKADRMLLTGMRNKAELDHRRQAATSAWSKKLAALLIATPEAR